MNMSRKAVYILIVCYFLESLSTRHLRADQRESTNPNGPTWEKVLGYQPAWAPGPTSPTVPLNGPTWEKVFGGYTTSAVGCPLYTEQAHCLVTLLSRTCEAAYGQEEDISASATCHKIYLTLSTPSAMWCLAASEDPGVLRDARRIAEVAAPTKAQCSVTEMRHLSEWWFASATRVSPLNKTNIPNRTRDLIQEACSAPRTPKELDSGFCEHPDMPGADCEFARGLFAGWSHDYGRKYCEGLGNHAGTWRCRALREQVIKGIEHEEFWTTAVFSKFFWSTKAREMFDRLNCKKFP